MKMKFSGLGVALFAVLQMSCGGKAPPPPADSSSAPPPAMGKVPPPPPPEGFRIGTQKEYDSLQAARKKRENPDSVRPGGADSTGR